MNLNFTITGQVGRKDQLSLQNERLIKLRWFYLSTLCVIASVFSYLAGNTNLAYRYAVIGIVGVSINTLLFVINSAAAKTTKVLKALMVAQLSLDLAIASVSTYQQGGLDARTTALFALPIVAAGLIFSHKIVYTTALMSGFGYVASLYFYSINHQESLTISDALVPFVFYPAFFLIFARLVVYLMRVTTKETREEAYDEYLALLSHQLKHPVSTVSAIIDFIEHTDNLSAAQQKKYVQMLKQENQHLLLLLNNLSETAAPSSAVPTSMTVNVAKLLQEIAYLTASLHNRPGDLKLKLHNMSLDVNANSERLKTALANVIDNAFRFSKTGTPVRVEFQKTQLSAIITIQDNGRGMTKANQAQIMNRYILDTQPEQGVEGLGLGLMVAYKIITDHHGNLTIASDRDGTTVTITLNRSKENE